MRLLESVDEFCGDRDLQGELSIAYARRGVKAGNSDQWDAAVNDLRRARQLNPYSNYINLNLVTALRSKAASSAEERAEESCRPSARSSGGYGGGSTRGPP